MKTKKALAGLFGLFGSFAAFFDCFFPAAAAPLLFSLKSTKKKKKTAHTPVSYTITDLRSNSVPSKTKKNSPAVSSSGISLCLTTFHDETLQKNDEKRWESVAERWESAWLGPSQRSLPLGLGFSAQRESERERESFGDRDNRERYVLLLCWSGEG